VTERLQLLHPADFKKLYGKKRRKNDKLDATALCQAAKLEMEGIWVPDEGTRQRRSLSTRRVSMTQRRTASMNAVRSAFREYHVSLAKDPWSAKGMKTVRERSEKLPPTIALGVELELEHIEMYNDSIAKLDQRMAELAWGNEAIELLMSVPGINYHSAFVIMAEIGDINRFDSAKQLASYAGLCPSISQSGQSGTRYGSITKKGRSRLRWIMVECGHIASRYAPKLQKLRWRIKKRSGITNIATVAVARKLLELCYYILKSGKPYSESVEAKHKAKLRKLRGKVGKRKAA
jgi:transposase